MKWLSNSPFYRCFSNQSCDRTHRLARALYICTWGHAAADPQGRSWQAGSRGAFAAHRGPLPRLMYPTCKHAAHLYQTVCEMQVSASPCPLACDVEESLPGLNRGMRLVLPVGATRTVCACAGIEYRAARSCVCVPNSALGELRRLPPFCLSLAGGSAAPIQKQRVWTLTAL